MMKMSMRVACLVILSACGGGGVKTTIAFLNGAGTGAQNALTSEAPLRAVAGGGFPFIASPDKVKVKFKSIAFAVDQHDQESVELTDCEVTFDRSQGSGSTALTCPFSVPEGTYDGIRIDFETTFQVLINDSVNGVYTDPSSPTLISNGPPPGGAQFVSYTSDGNTGGFGIPLPDPVTVTGGSTSISLIGDLNRAIQIGDGSGLLTLANKSGVPLQIVAVPGAKGNAELYQNLTPYMPNGPSNDATVSIFYNGDGKPVTAITRAVCTGWSGLEFGYAFDHDGAHSASFLAGAYLGMDATGTIAWQVPSLQGWDAGAATFVIHPATSIGGSTTISCQIGSENPPSGGATFAAGAPTIAATATQTVTLWAR